MEVNALSRRVKSHYLTTILIIDMHVKAMILFMVEDAQGVLYESPTPSSVFSDAERREEIWTLDSVLKEPYYFFGGELTKEIKGVRFSLKGTVLHLVQGLT